MFGAWRSVCQQAVSSRPNSVSSVRMITLAFRNENLLPEVPVRPSQSILVSVTAFLLRPAPEQPLRADPEVYRCFRILRLLGHVHTFLQSRDFHPRHVHCPVERGGIPRHFGGFHRGGNQHSGNYCSTQILSRWSVRTDECGYFPR